MTGEKRLNQLREQLLHHPLYQRLHSIEHLICYMEHHVFAVWDFMSLLKRLQSDLTGLSVPWYPGTRPDTVRVINEIVLAEESDEDGRGGYQSHFALYLEAMDGVGANTHVIASLIDNITHSRRWDDHIAEDIPEPAKQFVKTTMEIALQGKVHEVASAFFYGREEIIPQMFEPILRNAHATPRLERFRYYLDRHISLDGDSHGPLAKAMLNALIDSRLKEEEAFLAAERSLEARIALWDGVLQSLPR